MREPSRAKSPAAAWEHSHRAQKTPRGSSAKSLGTAEVVRVKRTSPKGTALQAEETPAIAAAPFGELAIPIGILIECSHAIDIPFTGISDAPRKITSQISPGALPEFAPPKSARRSPLAYVHPNRSMSPLAVSALDNARGASPWCDSPRAQPFAPVVPPMSIAPWNRMAVQSVLDPATDLLNSARLACDSLDSTRDQEPPPRRPPSMPGMQRPPPVARRGAGGSVSNTRLDSLW